MCNALELPNDKLISDHLPIESVFSLSNICENNNNNNNNVKKCECCVKEKVTRLRNKINKNKRRKERRMI